MEANAEYLVIAHVLGAESRPWFGLPWTGEPALGSNQFGCGIRPIPSLNAKFVGDAPSYPPKSSFLVVFAPFANFVVKAQWRLCEIEHVRGCRLRCDCDGVGARADQA